MESHHYKKDVKLIAGTTESAVVYIKMLRVNMSSMNRDY